MRCPECDVKLIWTERLNVRAGYCPECEGEWFARRAVEVLLDRAARAGGDGGPPAAADGRDESPAIPGPAPIAAAGRRDELWNWF